MLSLMKSRKRATLSRKATAVETDAGQALGAPLRSGAGRRTSVVAG